MYSLQLGPVDSTPDCTRLTPTPLDLSRPGRHPAEDKPRKVTKGTRLDPLGRVLVYIQNTLRLRTFYNSQKKYFLLCLTFYAN